MASLFTTTTRLTSAEPKGMEKVFQDQWDEKRETQVRTKMTYETKQSLVNYMATLKTSVDNVALGPKFSKENPQMTFVYGSYDITDRTKTNQKWIANQMERIVGDKSSLMNKYMKSKNVGVMKIGVRTTHIIEFNDGSYVVCDPTVPTAMNGRIPKDIRPIDTLYCVMVRMA